MLHLAPFWLFPGSLKHYGPPFTAEDGKPSSSPALQALVSKFALPLPGLRDLSEDFWKIRVHELIEDLEKANLSESYDKGVIGSRKTLATAVSALIEYPVRGTFGGFAQVDNAHQHYDITKADDLQRGFRDFINGTIYGTSLEELVVKAGETDDLEEHPPSTKAVHEFVLVNLASFMHYTLILSPKGQYLLKLMDNANKLVPYLVIRQTLKIGNVASMISAMVRVVLTKMSVTSLTNWMGLTQSKDEGMNLLQHIISTVLNWDIKDLESRAGKLERERAQLGKDQLQALKDYTTKPREDQEKIRKQSREQALEYLNIQLSIRDRKQIIQTLCHSSPDHLTQAVRDLVAAYEPVIRRMHEAVDLSGTVSDFEQFLRDIIKLAKVQTTNKDGKDAVVPTVGDFAQLLRKHQKSSHRFIHQCCKNGPELVSWYLEWAKKAATEFKQKSPTTTRNQHETAAGDLTEPLNKLFSSLSPDQQSRILPILDAHTSFLDQVHASSHARLVSVLQSRPSKHPSISKLLTSTSTSSSVPPSPPPTDLPTASSASAQPSPTFKIPSSPTPLISSDPGPGAYLTRWQDLLDNTPITASTQQGKVDKASSPEVVNRSTRDVDGEQLVKMEEGPAKGEGVDVQEGKERDVEFVVKCLGEGFRKLIAERSCDW
ncbi:putative succinate dehydrogenase flavoprotein subunit [Phaeomoniella chlamydospora]|uniref:Putative succinate dehydrogenase flavoprotein subunit n=1 Tax=Phaeomoniella chlamydospora TaxID=158046 RepID=A0A0G2GT20_PHACM|nr:putative succinate dehydrogenase flavoprotein subunit [Phaeomoniella chlamydospora]